MLAHLTTAFIVAAIVANLIALGLVGHRLTRDYAMSRVTAPVAAALALFFIEHFVGLGRLAWSWPITTAASLALVWRHREVVRAHWRVEAAFLAAFAWAFAWRFTSPTLTSSSEQIGDLAMISSYLPGSRLPPTDAWFPPFPFDVYYSFQHYAAALLGRIFAFGPGLTYNLAFSLAIALTLTAAAAAIHTVSRSAPRTLLVLAAFAVGGTGATIPVHFLAPRPPLHSSMRFIGESATAAPVPSAFSSWLSAHAGPGEPALRLPSETFAYLMSLGDYHPPLSGFFLLALALLCIAHLETGATSRSAEAVLAATVPVCAISNTWSLPLQGLLVATWVAHRVVSRNGPDWRALAAGALGAMALCYPFLGSFAYRAADYAVALRLVPPGLHTPLVPGVIVLAPVVVAILAPAALGERRRWVLWSSLLWGVLLLFSELFFIDDVYGGENERFNTTLKWWPWIQAGALLTAGAYGVGARSRALRYVTIATLASVAVYGIDLGRALFTGPKPGLGQLDGAALVTSDPIERVVLEYLKAQPRGIVLQRLQAGAFTPAPALTLFAGQVAFLGWPEHERLWRGMRADVERRDEEVKRFFAGAMPDAAAWLTQNRIEHVLWLRTEAELQPGTFDIIDRQLRGAYFWREYYRVDEFRVGVWSRRH